MPLIPTEHSVLQIMPTTGLVEFLTSTETWHETLIGYAVVVDTVATEVSPATGQPLPRGHVEYETTVQPLILDEGRPVTIDDYLADRNTAGLTWRVVQ